MSLLTTLKGLPMTYNRDLQEDKEPLFDSIDTVKLVLRVFAEMIEEMQVNESKTAEATSDPFLLATDIADYLVLKGVPFRQAHEIVGQLTAFSIQESTGFPDIKLEDYQNFCDVFAEDVFDLFDVKKALEARKAVGAPSPENVANQVARWKRELAS